MGKFDLGINLAKEVSAYMRTSGKGLLHTRPSGNINIEGLRYAPQLESDIVQITRNSSVPTYKISRDLSPRLESVSNGQKLFNEQYCEFWALRNHSVSHEASTVIKQGDLIHGSTYSPEGVRSILRDGIVTGDVSYGKKAFFQEDGETFGCADFFINPKTCKIDEYFGSFVTRNLGIRKAPEKNYLPWMQKIGIHGNRQLGFIVDAEKLSKDSKVLLKNSATPNNLNKSNLNGIIQGFPQYENLQAILVGVPSNYISKIVIGNGITKSEIQEIKQLANEYRLDLKIYDLMGNIL